MRYLATYEAQARVEPKDYEKLLVWQRQFWMMLLLACQSPGLPIDDPRIQAQLVVVWGKKSVTYQRLLA